MNKSVSKTPARNQSRQRPIGDQLAARPKTPNLVVNKSIPIIKRNPSTAKLAKNVVLIESNNNARCITSGNSEDIKDGIVNQSYLKECETQEEIERLSNVRKCLSNYYREKGVRQEQKNQSVFNTVDYYVNTSRMNMASSQEDTSKLIENLENRPQLKYDKFINKKK